MPELVLVTGGAGFVGSFLVDELIARGYTVRVFDCLEAQVHGTEGRQPPYLNPDADFIRGDVRDREALKKALRRLSLDRNGRIELFGRDYSPFLSIPP